MLTPAERQALASRPFDALSLPWQPGRNTPLILVSAAGHRGRDLGWVAGQTAEPPHAENTVNDNEYEDGPEPGHMWPYMVAGATMEHGTASGGSGTWYPLCQDNSGINHYRRGFPLRRGMLGRRGGRLQVQLAGRVEAPGPGEYAVEVALQPDLQSAWNGGRGGDAASPGSFGANGVFFRSPDFSSLSLGGAPGELFFEAWALSLSSHSLLWRGAFTLAAPGENQVFEARSVLRTQWNRPPVHDLETRDSNVALLFKVDGKSGGQYLPAGTVNDSAFGSSTGFSPPNVAQDGSECRFRAEHLSVVLWPGA